MTPRSDSATGVEPHEALNIAAAADQASAAVHNIAAHVDANATRDAWQRSHQAFLFCRCELRRKHPERAMEALRTMLGHLDTLIALAQQTDLWPKHLAAGVRTTEALRKALAEVKL